MARPQANAQARPAARRSARTNGGMPRLEVILGDAGIPKDQFERAAATALAELRATPGPSVDDPASQLTDEERRALEIGGLDLSPRRSRDPDPLAETAARYAALLADSETVAEVADRLGVTRARVRQRAIERTLLAVREDDEWRFPRAQFSDGAPIRGLPAVAIALPHDLHPVAAWGFLRHATSDLELEGRDCSPLEWLRSGGSPDPVVALAREL
jgi:hypothetical protein